MNHQISQEDLDWYDNIRKEYLAEPLLEIDEGRFTHMLEVLPPMQWVKNGNFERFCMMEFNIGDVTQQYARLGHRYFTKSVTYGDVSTYVTPQLITDFDIALAGG